MEDTKLLMGRIAVICRIVDLSNGPSGKTKIHKIVYFLQEGLREGLCLPLGYYFKMHYYGPYSVRLEDRLALAKAMGYVDITLAPDGFGYNISPLDPHVDDAEHSLHLSEEIDEMIRELLAVPLLDLELWATVHFIQRLRPTWAREKVVDTVRRVKPKFTAERIDTAYQNIVDMGLLKVQPTTGNQNRGDALS